MLRANNINSILNLISMHQYLNGVSFYGSQQAFFGPLKENRTSLDDMK
jgi:hypothetical protein